MNESKPCANCGEQLYRNVIACGGTPNDMQPIYGYGSPGHYCPALMAANATNLATANNIQNDEQREQAVMAALSQNVWSGV